MTDNVGMKKIVEMIVVDADGEIITAANGLVSSDNPELVRLVKHAAKSEFPIQLIAPFGRTVAPNLNPTDLVGVTAALFAARPGRTKLLEAPAEVWNWLDEEAGNSEGDSFGGATSVAEHRAMRDAVSNPSQSVENERVRSLMSFFGTASKGIEG